MQANPSDETLPHFDPKDEALRRDVSRLGERLGALLREIAPAGTFDKVEAARLLSRRRRAGDSTAEGPLEQLLEGLTPATALELVRAFSAYFGVVNMAEQAHRMRRRIDYARRDEAQPGSLRAAADGLAAASVGAEEVRSALAEILVEPVFTAHPTEAVRRTLLKKDQRLARALVARFPTDLDPRTRERLDAMEALEIASAWQTEEQLPGKPSVAEEVEHVLFFLSDVLYHAVPAVHEEMERALASAYGEPFHLERALVRFSSWVGGDMDGNPNVGSATIRETLARHLELLLRRYADELRALHEHLSQSSSRVAVAPALLARIREYEERMPDELQGIPDRYQGMPYRQLLWLMSARLRRKGERAPEGYGPPEELLADLELIAQSLREHGGASAGLALVRRATLRVQVFGFHLAGLDVRQDAEVHRRALADLLGEPDFMGWTRAARTAHLAEVLARSEPPTAMRATGAEARATLDVFRALTEARERYGARALGPFIISMAQGADDALAVLLLARAAGFRDPAGAVPLDIAPLFETVEDLRRAPGVLAALAADPTYAAHLASRGMQQMVMLGYSDSNKDGGIAASRVGIDRAQEELAACAEELNLNLTLFHGRGGSISRGGSKPRAGLLATPTGALRGHARSTEQGEIIGAKFGLRGIATRTLEVSLAALLERSAGLASPRTATPEDRAIAETLSRESRAHYRRLVHEDPGFKDLFQGMTPIDVIERLDIGSRPARRRQMRGVQDLRAIPWVFAWTQCRAGLTGWYGVGAGLAAAIEEHGLESVRQSAHRWPFLATFLSDVEMVLAKSDIEIAARYAELAGDTGKRLFPQIRGEHERSIQHVLQIKGAQRLLASDPTLQRSIQLRNPYVDPLSFVQIELLARWRAGDREDEELTRVLIQTVRGIARGLRNTG